MRSSTATATTAIADSPYVGRFAPSPTGELHLGSLLTAVASYLDARSVKGRWLLRVEDLDVPREVPGAADRILRCLESFGLQWDGTPLRQTERASLYREAIAQLEAEGRLYRCACSRQQLQSRRIYPGTCWLRAPGAAAETATRFHLLPQSMSFEDRIQGSIEQDPSLTFGDFVVVRRDRLIAYMLAVVIDDAEQGITDVVRGADLLDSTLPQIQLQQALDLPQPRYAHVPLLVEPDGAKLAKSRRSVSLTSGNPARQLCTALTYLGQNPPPQLCQESLHDIWHWALKHWRLRRIPPRRDIPVHQPDPDSGP